MMYHSLGHSFASLLIQSGASLTCVKEQTGHSPIQVTVDIYGHLVPGGNIKWMGHLSAPLMELKVEPRDINVAAMRAK
jgi:integrase